MRTIARIVILSSGLVTVNRLNAQLTLLSSFNPANAGGFCGLAFDTDSALIWAYDCDAAIIQQYTTAGVFVRSIPMVGGAADDVDLTFTPESQPIGASTVDPQRLLVINGESGVADIFALDHGTGATIGSLATAFGASHVVGGGYHPIRNSFFLLQDEIPVAALDNLIAEVDPISGAVLGQFDISGIFDVSYGDLEISPESGDLFVVSSLANAIAEFTPTGTLVTTHTLPAGVTSLSGLGIDCATGEAWVCNTGGVVYKLGNFPCGGVCPGAEAGTPCDDGNAATVSDVVQANCSCAGVAPSLKVGARVFLEGSYNATTGLMSDPLRSLASFPLTDPYPALGYTHSGGSGGADIAASVLATTGNDAIVDWVLLELRNAASPAVVMESRSALVQRDGDVVELDGVSPVGFAAAAGDYHVAARHRNHLGAMTSAPIALSLVPVTIDFTATTTTTYGMQARKSITGAFPAEVLWMGDATFNGQVKYTGTGNDRDPILVAVGSTTPNSVLSGSYSTRDLNLNGEVKYTGTGNDRDPILVNVGSTTPNNIRTQQLP